MQLAWQLRGLRCAVRAVEPRSLHPTAALPERARSRRTRSSQPSWGASTLQSQRGSTVITRAAAAAGVPQPAGGSSSSSTSRRFAGLLPSRDSLRVVEDAWALLCANLWAVVAVFAAKDAAAFVLHRIAHRLTNSVAESVFGVPISSLGNPWWIMMDAKLLEGHAGYQFLVGCVFLLCLPLNILLNTAAVATAAVVCTSPRPSALAQPSASFSSQGSGKVGLAQCRSGSSGASLSSVEDAELPLLGAALLQQLAGSGSGAASFRGAGAVSFRHRPNSGSSSKAGLRGAAVAASSRSVSSSGKQPVQQLQRATAAPLPWLVAARPKQWLPQRLALRPSLAMAHAAWSKQVCARLAGLWRVDLLYNCWSLPLQAACLAVLPAFWAFPRLIDIQLSLPAAVLGSAAGKQALERSRGLMSGFRSAYAWPFVWLIVAGRLLELVRELVLVSLPVRWWTDVVEVPLAATAAFAAVRVLLLRLQDLVPLAAYLLLTRRGSAAAAAAGSARAGS